MRAMRTYVTVVEGSEGLPVVVFTHGIGMSKGVWLSPEDEPVMGGILRLEAMLRDEGPSKTPPRTLFHEFRDRGHSAIAWSQSRPVGPADLAVRELLDVVSLARQVKGRGLAFVCHSRGGLILRAALPLIPEARGGGIRAVVTLGTPHAGSSLARWAVYLKPLAALLKERLPRSERGMIARSMHKAAGFIESEAVLELLPESGFLASLTELRPAGAACVSIGGTDPRLLRAARAFRLPDILYELLPDRVLPEEMRDGLGDGLVAARSAVLPYGDSHRNLALNHAELLTSREAHETVLGLVAGAME